MKVELSNKAIKTFRFTDKLRRRKVTFKGGVSK